jgi:flavodoxin
MNCLIALHSYHHHNTQKVAEAIAGIIGAVIKAPGEINNDELPAYNLLGFGSGIDSGQHYPELLAFAQSLPVVDGQKCFIFSTSGVQGKEKVSRDHSRLRQILQAKNYEVIGEFSCRGFNTNSFLKFFGGMNKNRPNAEDLKNAEKFAHMLKTTQG